MEERGFKPKEGESATGKKKAEKGWPTIKQGIQIIETLYREDRLPGVAKDCFKMIHLICKNIIKDPSEMKFRSINLENEKIRDKIAKINGGLMVLKGLGFTMSDADTRMVLEDDQLDTDLIKEVFEKMSLKI